MSCRDDRTMCIRTMCIRTMCRRKETQKEKELNPVGPNHQQEVYDEGKSFVQKLEQK